MKEHYIEQKVNSLFPVKHSAKQADNEKESRVNEIMGRMNDEIDRSCYELQYKLKRMLSLCLKTHI